MPPRRVIAAVSMDGPTLVAGCPRQWPVRCGRCPFSKKTPPNGVENQGHGQFLALALSDDGRSLYTLVREPNNRSVSLRSIDLKTGHSYQSIRARATPVANFSIVCATVI